MAPLFSRPLKVVLADDHELVRAALKALLSTLDGVEVVAEARDGEELLARLESVQPDVVLTDLSMPRMDGITAIARIRERFPSLRIIVVSMCDSVDFVKRAVASGASGYVLKHATPAELAQALRTVMATGSYFNSAVAKLLMQKAERAPADGLTQRQVEVLACLARGLTAKEIGFELGLSRKTVDVHRARIMDRLRVNNVAGLTRYALRQGLVQG